MTMKAFIVVWQAYGDWKCTANPFTSEAKAIKHGEYLRTRTATGNDNKHIQVLPVTINEEA